MSHSPQMTQGQVLCSLAQFVLSSGSSSKHHEVLSLFLLLVTVAFPDIFLFFNIIWLCQVLVVTPRSFDLRCSTWDLVPWLEIETRPPALGTWGLSHWTIREVPFPGIWLTYWQISASSLKDFLLEVLSSTI